MVSVTCEYIIVTASLLVCGTRVTRDENLQSLNFDNCDERNIFDVESFASQSGLLTFRPLHDVTSA